MGRAVDKVCDEHARMIGSRAGAGPRAPQLLVQRRVLRPRAREGQRSGQRVRNYCGVP